MRLQRKTSNEFGGTEDTIEGSTRREELKEALEESGRKRRNSPCAGKEHLVALHRDARAEGAPASCAASLAQSKMEI